MNEDINTSKSANWTLVPSPNTKNHLLPLSELQSPSEIIGTTAKNGVVADSTSNVKLFLETIW